MESWSPVFCPECNSQLREGAAFCLRCGAKRAGQTAQKMKDLVKEIVSVPNFPDVYTDDISQKAKILFKLNTFLIQYPDVHVQQIEHNLRIASSSPESNAIMICLDDSEIVLDFKDWHYPFTDPDEAIDCIRKLISGHARLEATSYLGFLFWLEIQELNTAGKWVTRYITANFPKILPWGKTLHYFNGCPDA